MVRAMKRGMTGGTYRGPVAHARQRRTIRFMQVLFVLIALGLFAFAAVSLRAVRADPAPRAGEIAAANRTSPAQPVVLALLGAVSVGAAAALGGRKGVRVPTPARLDELAGRAQATVSRRAADSSGTRRETARRR